MTTIKKHSEISQLWLSYKEGIKYYILKKVKDEFVANDLSHDVLMKVYNSCCSENKILNIRSWLFQIAHNTVVDYMKKTKKITNNIPELFDENEINSYQGADTFVNPLLQLIPEKYAIPLKLSDLEGLKQAEVAKKLNLSLTATKSRIQRSRKLLKEKIIECFDLELDDKGKPISFEVKITCKPLQEFKNK